MTSSEKIGKVGNVLNEKGFKRFTMTREEFKAFIDNGYCPFCEFPLKHYEGSLGYEAMQCKGCRLVIDHVGIHLED